MLHQIGVGALGPVFRTYEPTRDRLVAVKVFRLDVTPEQARSLADELGRAADAGLFHPSIVEPVAAGLEGTVAYRAEEYVAAESLDVAMRHYAPATLDKVLPFITQLASAIDFARAAGVGHGALHPRDIFVTPDEARATGFGVVDAMDRLGLRAPVRRPYSPPERVAGQSWSTPADVFSLAAIAFELLTGRRPSGAGDDMGSLSGAILAGRTDEVRAVLVKALHEQPSERYQTACEFSAALAGAAGLDEVHVSPALYTVAAQAPPALPNPEVPSAVSAEAVVLARSVEAPADLPLANAAAAASVPVDVPIQSEGSAADTDGLTAASEDETQGLEDFAEEADVPSSSDSPREAARKAIAAREVRKRQHKKKVERVLFEPPAADTEPVASTESAEDDTLVAAPASPPIPAEPQEAVLDVASTAAARTKEIEESEETVATAAVGTVPLEAVELAPVERDLSDRVIAVDEFRAREAAAKEAAAARETVKADRMWSKAPERPVERPLFERHDRTASLRLSESPGGSDPLAPEEPARQQMMMLPLALALSLGIIIGLAGGYYWASRDRQGAPAQAVSSVPTTGIAPPPATGDIVPPPGASAVPAASEAATPSAVNAPPSAPAPTPEPPARSPRAAGTVATSGRIVVNSTPAKAGVTVNGKWRGRTPITLTGLKFGSYVVRVVEPGYAVEREQFSLSSGSASRTVDVALKRKPEPKRAPVSAPATAKPSPQAHAPSTPTATTTGTIYIDSRPQGARVFVDNKDAGVTPLTLNGQAAGSHDIRLELADHAPRSEKITVKPGATARVTGSLERIR